MKKRTLKVALLAVLATVLLLGISTAALADQTWKDLPDTVTAKYGITDNQVAAISEGFAGGLWKPFKSVTRAQFTKMAVSAFNIPQANSAIASYTDVPKSNFYYPYVEGAKAAGVVSGTTATTFSPNVNITRQQAIAIVARYIAKAQGYDLASMYTAAEITALLSHFGDALSISSDLRDEVAFAFDMGLTNGDDFGNIKPLANLTRIQGAAFLIRAQALVPPQLWIPAKIELVGADKTEGLIGQTYTATFKVTTADGHPAKDVLVDLDSLGGAEFYVGNVTKQAAVTDSFGEVKVNLISMEPGTQRVTATVAGVGTIYTTRYWLVLDEVYNLKGYTAQNNAGVEHEWAVRVVVFGPGPMSTSQGDWYNGIDISNAFDPTNIDVRDGVDVICDYPAVDDNMTYEGDEIPMAQAPWFFKPRTMAGIDVEWAIYDVPDNPLTKLTNEAITSVGNIIKVDGVAITPAKTAVGKTNADGYSSITVYSEVTGKTLTEAVADYAGNPYPEQLFNHDTFQDWQSHDEDWDDQPVVNALQMKTWIAHTIGGGGTGPISPAYQAPNLGEEKILTITLVDTYGNPVAGKYVEWYMQGVGFFQTDDSGDTSDPEVAASNKDYDVTNAQGKATLFVKSYESGEQIIHAKVRDKGTGGAEGPYITYTAEVQWFDVDIVTFDNITTVRQWVYDYDLMKYLPVDNNEALSENPVNGSHTFDLHVYGLKLEYDSTTDEPDGQTMFIDSDAAGHSYDGIIDYRDAAYFGGILMCPSGQQLSILWDDKIKLFYETQPGLLPFDYNNNGIIEANAEVWVDANVNGLKDAGEVVWVDERGTSKVKVAGVWLTLSYEGAYTMYDFDDDGHKEAFAGLPGVYLPLAGKSVVFTRANEDGLNFSNLGTYFDGAKVAAVGSFTPTSAVTTDAAGKASVTVTSNVKGPETIKAVVDWPGNPHNGPELLSAYAKKNWVAGTVGAATDVTIEVFLGGVKVATNKAGELAEGKKAAWTSDPNTGNLVLNSTHVSVHVKDVYGNDLPDYEVVYLLESIDSWLGGSQNATDTFIPWAYLVDIDTADDDLNPDGTVYDQNGSRPDSDEPLPSSDPYAYIVGPGGTEAFFFNQWLGSQKETDAGQAGLRTWWVRVSGYLFDDYVSALADVNYTYTWPRPWLPNNDPDGLFNGFDGVLETPDPIAPIEIGLATDGAKAWTLDGYFMYREGVVPNLLTGSNVDIQLAEDIRGTGAEGIHVKSILRVMVYAPANGLVQEGAYIWSTQVHQVWEEPVVTSVILSPAADYAIAGLEDTQVVATVRDQFGNPMPGVDVYFDSVDSVGASGAALEGSLNNLFNGTLINVMVTTDANGNSAVSWGQDPGNWGVEKVVATAGSVTSNAALIQWIYIDDSGTLGDLVNAVEGQQKVTVYAGFALWNGRTARVYLNPGGTVLGSGTYVDSVDLSISTNTHTWTAAETFFVGATSTNVDGVPNWVYDVVPTP